MTQYIFIDADGDEWKLKNGRWETEMYPGLEPGTTQELYDRYGGKAYAVVENWDDIPLLAEEPLELGTVYNHPNKGSYVRYAESFTTDKPWVGTISRLFYSWSEIHE